MENNFNLKNENLKKSIINIINDSNLPISNVYYILTILYKEIENLYYMTLNEETFNKNQTNEEDQAE